MTIGEILRTQTRRNIWLGLTAWIAFAGSMFLTVTSGLQMLPLFFFIPFIGVVLLQMFSVRCPRCNGNLGQLMAQTLAPGRFKARVTCCPFCGVSFSDRSR